MEKTFYDDKRVVSTNAQIVHSKKHVFTSEFKHKFKLRLHDSIANKVASLGDEPTNDKVKAIIAHAVESSIKELEGYAKEALDNYEKALWETKLTKELVSDFLGYGPLDALLEEDGISEIMVNPLGVDPKTGSIVGHEVIVEKEGRLYPRPDIVFEGESHVRHIMHRIVSRQGRRIDDANPIVDATLADGSRFNGTLYPLCPDGSTFNIRMFNDNVLSAENLLASNTMSREELEFLKACVKSRCSILISGGTGAGKTTLLNALAESIDPTERIITIEDTCELLVYKTHHHTVRFEARPSNSEGKGLVSMDDHLRAALRKRPDRIVIGECRGPEAYTMLEAMSTGHEGSMTTIHANDPSSALIRLVTLVKQADPSLSEETIKTKIAQAIDLIIQVKRTKDGARRISAIEAIGGYSDGNIQHDVIFRLLVKEENGRQTELHVPCKTQPFRIKEKIEQAGVVYDKAWFMPKPTRFEVA